MNPLTRSHHLVAFAVLATVLVPGLCAAQDSQPRDADPKDAEPHVLLLTGYQVDLADPNGLTTFFSVHNQGSSAMVATATTYDRESNFLREDVVTLQPNQNHVFYMRSFAPDLVPDADGVARGWVKIVGESIGLRSKTLNVLWGDYFLVDPSNAAARGGKLVAEDELCDAAILRLLDFGDDAVLTLYSTDPHGVHSQKPTAIVTAYENDGEMLDSFEIFTDDTVHRFALGDSIGSRFATLRIDFAGGTGSAAGEYTFYGRYFSPPAATCAER